MSFLSSLVHSKDDEMNQQCDRLNLKVFKLFYEPLYRDNTSAVTFSYDKI